MLLYRASLSVVRIIDERQKKEAETVVIVETITTAEQEIKAAPAVFKSDIWTKFGFLRSSSWAKATNSILLFI